MEDTTPSQAVLKHDAVYAWRKQEFVRLGFATVTADLLASETRIDLHAAELLVKTRGCPPSLAVQILF